MAHVPRVMCLTCGVPMKIVKNGFNVKTTIRSGDYYIISTDSYECPFCKCFIALPAQHPIAMSHDKNFTSFSFDSIVSLEP